MIPSNAAELLAFNSSCGALNTNFGDLPPDPSPIIPVYDNVNGAVVATSTSLIFKNFRSPLVKIDPMRLFAVTGNAQYDIVKGVVADNGDHIPRVYNFEWHSGRIWLRINHHIDDGMKWSIMARAVKGVSDWGWNNGFVATSFVVLDNMVEVGTGELGVGFGENAASTA